MSYCKKVGKDVIIFATKEDHEKPSNVTLTELDNNDDKRGLILSNGDINWNCPCLGGMASGPCGYQFREAFSCFHYSQSETKGSECIEKFSQMQECMSQFPNLYPTHDEDEDQDFKEQFNNDLDQELAQKSEINKQSSVEDKDQKKT